MSAADDALAPFREGRRARAMLLGTFHFQDRGLDRYRPAATFDVVSERGQREIAEVVELLTAFRPTTIAVERTRQQQAAIDQEYAAYRRGDFALPADKVGAGDDYPGADWVTGWYNRNLRIFANLQRITAAPDDRLLLIIGGGHAPILRHCVLASPEYELVEVEAYLATPATERRLDRA
jgi:hypothetical protein